MPCNRTTGQAQAAAPTLAELSVNELTAALGVSDMPARGWRNAPRGQLATWAQQGIDRLGLQAVRETAARTTYLDYADRGIGTITPAESAELRGMWASARRLDASYGGAYRLRAQLAADLLGVPVSEVEHSARPAAAVAERATSRAITTAELDAAVARAERRVAAVLEKPINPQATPAEIAWARNWGAEAENAATGTPELLPHLTK